MPSINISESDFTALAMAANDALDRGDREAAEALDKIARKVNAALAHNTPTARIARMAGGVGRSISWQQVPSTLAHNPRY